MEELLVEEIRIGPLKLRYFVDGSRTNGAVDCFEFAVPAQTTGTHPHYHEGVDELVFGVEGRVTFTVDGQDRVIGPRDFCFIPRGVVHCFSNKHDTAAVALSVLTPALIGPAYFREMAAVAKAVTRPDPLIVKSIMERHGLMPV
ncbi:MAG TPA: cupin domain-containing protein [Spirochaetia bacterium]|nr:cupin domain-containing protein [Spirochaetia bacterium]